MGRVAEPCPWRQIRINRLHPFFRQTQFRYPCGNSKTTILRGGISMIEIGKKAHDFCLPSADQEQVCLKDYAGKWVVLFFYVKDDTSG